MRSEDEVTIQQVGTGDQAALGRLYDRFERPVYSLAMRTLNDRHQAEEVVQDTFMKIWKSAGRYESTAGAPSTWIFTIAKRTAIDVWRREKRIPVPSEHLPEETSSPPAPGDQEWTAWELNTALAQLPGEQREVIDQFVILGFSHSQVAERLGLPIGTVKTRIYSGLRRLREELRSRSAVEGTT